MLLLDKIVHDGNDDEMAVKMDGGWVVFFLDELAASHVLAQKESRHALGHWDFSKVKTETANFLGTQKSENWTFRLCLFLKLKTTISEVCVHTSGDTVITLTVTLPINRFLVLYCTRVGFATVGSS